MEYASLMISNFIISVLLRMEFIIMMIRTKGNTIGKVKSTKYYLDETELEIGDIVTIEYADENGNTRLITNTPIVEILEL